MQTTPTPLPALLSTINDMVASAAAGIPEAMDQSFLTYVTQKALHTFWTEYMKALPETVRDELAVIVENEDAEALLGWSEKYADFEHSAYAQELASDIFVAIEERLPALLQEELRIFASQTA